MQLIVALFATPGSTAVSNGGGIQLCLFRTVAKPNVMYLLFFVNLVSLSASLSCRSRSVDPNSSGFAIFDVCPYPRLGSPPSAQDYLLLVEIEL